MNHQDNAKDELVVEIQHPLQEEKSRKKLIDHGTAKQFSDRKLSLNFLRKGRYSLVMIGFALFIALMIFPVHKSMASADDGRKRVLIIHSYHSGLSWSDNISNSIRKEFINEKQIDIFTEFLDTKHIALSQSEDTYKIYFSIKYKKFRPDVIIVSDNDALDFVLRNRINLFPDIPIVFCAINNFNTELLKGQKNITGVVEETAPLKTINLMLAQNQDLQRLVIISDQTTTGMTECNHVEKDLRNIKKSIKIEWWKTLREKDLQSKLSKLDKGDAVLLILFNQDASGKYFSYEESAEMITKYSPVPVYGLWDFYLNHGIVGGCLTNSNFQGKSAAQLATKILNHEKADNIPFILLSPNECILDARVVKKFDLEDPKLSEPVVYINEQPNWVKENFILICIVLSLLILEALIILLLFWQKHKSNLKYIQILKENADRFHQMFFQHSAIMILHNPENGNIVDVNLSAIKFYGYMQEEFCTMSVYQLNCEDKTYIDECLANAKSGKENLFVFHHKLASGEIRTIEAHASPFDTMKGKLLLTIVTDITEKLEIEKNLKNSEQNFHIFFESVKDLMFVCDYSGNVIYVNSAVTEKLGYPIDEINKINLLTSHPKLRKKQVSEIFDSMLKGDLNYCQFPMLTKNGDLIPFETHIWYGKWDGKDSIFGISKDLSQEAALGKFKNFFYTNPSIMSIVNASDNKFMDVNKAFLDKLNYKAEEIIGKTATDIHFFVAPEIESEILKEMSKSGLIYNKELEFRTRDNGILTGLFSQELVEIKAEQMYLMVITDITIQKRAEELLKIKSIEIESQNNELRSKNDELLTAKEHAEESDRLKSAFLANMSHEIRTPMNGILGFSSLLKQSNLTGEKQQEYLKVIEKSGHRMLCIINDIIDISKIEAGLMLVNRKALNINELIDSLYHFFTPEVEEKGLHLIIKNKLSDEEALIRTDREKVNSILTNLIKNAIKFTSQGFIELGCILKTVSEPVELEFFVKDTGIGIPKERQEAIFERFIQADIEDKSAWQGAGLGLAISKAYVEMLGGKIWLESVEGTGTTFYFTLPYTAELKAESDTTNVVLDEAVEPAVRNLKILIAEDDEGSEMLISQEVKLFSKEILTARTGFEAVEICRKTPDIDLILMDIRMPVMDGYVATRQIREFNKDVIIFAQTAYALAGDREKAIDAGCNDYISKPIIKEQLWTLIHKYIG